MERGHTDACPDAPIANAPAPAPCDCLTGRLPVASEAGPRSPNGASTIRGKFHVTPAVRRSSVIQGRASAHMRPNTNRSNARRGGAAKPKTIVEPWRLANPGSARRALACGSRARLYPESRCRRTSRRGTRIHRPNPTISKKSPRTRRAHPGCGNRPGDSGNAGRHRENRRR